MNYISFLKTIFGISIIFITGLVYYSELGIFSLNKSHRQTAGPVTQIDKKTQSKHVQDSTDSVKSLQTQNERKHILQSKCKAYHNSIPTGSHLMRVYYNTKQGGSLYYCNVPKLGSTFLMHFFDEVFKASGIDRENYFKTQHANTQEVSYINVGDPYARLFSAYKDKLFRPNYQFWNKIGKYVFKTVRKNVTQKDGGYDITFAELVEYVVYAHEHGIELNPHLEPIHKLCYPCQTRFDYIGKKETMSDDLENLFDILKTTDIVGDDIQVSKIEKTIKEHLTYAVSANSVLAALKKHPQLSAYKLFLRHWSTFQMSGIVLNKYEFPFSESNIKYVSNEVYTAALHKAIDNSVHDQEQLSKQRHEALVQAYRTVPLSLMSRLREFVKVDCLLFSYEDNPAYLFDRTNYTDPISHVYMKGLVK